MNLKRFAAVALGVILILFASLAYFLIRSTELLDQSARDIAAASESIQFAEELKTLLLTHNRNAFLSLLEEQPTRLVSRRIQANQLQSRLLTIGELVSSPEEALIVNRLEEEMADYLSMRETLDNSSLPPLEQYTRISTSVDSTISFINRLVEVNRVQMDSLMALVARQNLVSDRIAFSLLGAGLAILLGLSLAILLLATRPLSDLAQVIARYGEGNEQSRFEGKGLQEIRDIGATFNLLADKLEEKRRERMKIIAAIAHDIRTPLNSLSLAAEFLVLKSSEEQMNLARVIARQVAELDRQVSDLLDTSRREDGELGLILAEHDVKEVISDVVELFRNASPAHVFVAELAEGALVCVCDRGRLMQVMNNLFSNAVKYSPAGGQITVTARRQSGSMEISVADEGPGIDPGDLEKIFEDFYRSDTVRGRISGIGLGLSTSRRIIEAHKGTLTAKSVPGKGAVFYIRLPLANEKKPA